MASWQQILSCGDPIEADLAEFAAVTDEFRRFHLYAREVADEFDAIERGYTTGIFQGEAADAFRSLISDVTQAVKCLPTVLSGIESTFQHHTDELRVLRRKADEALARAQTHWTAVQSRQASVDGLRTNRERLLDQLSYMEGTSDGSPESEQEVLLRRDEYERGRQQYDAARASLNRAHAQLEGVRDEWQRLRDAERRLDEETRARLEKQSLWELGDPSTWEQVTAAGAKLVAVAGRMAALGPVVGLISMLPDDVLWAIHDAFDTVSYLLAGCGVVVFFFPLIPYLGVALLVLGALKLAVDATIYFRGAVDPSRPDRRIAGSQLLLDAVLVGFSAGGHIAKAVPRGQITNPQRLAELHRFQLADEALGVVDAGLRLGRPVFDAGAVGAVDLAAEVNRMRSMTWDSSASQGCAHLAQAGAW